MTLLTELLPGAALAPLSVDQYHAMIRNGILNEGESLELIDGLLVRKDRRDHQGDIMTVGPRHAKVLGLLADLLQDLLRALPLHVRSQMPVTLSGIQEPEPDISIVKGARRDYSEAHPSSENIFLLIEIANRSLNFDRTSKLRMYAEAGIPEYWIINLVAGTIEIYRSPQADQQTYQSHVEIAAAESVTFDLCSQNFRFEANEVLA